jgi:copper chaperone CopZ
LAGFHGILNHTITYVREVKEMAEALVKIAGMSCQHCVMAVKKALGGVPGILESTVQVGSALVKYDESRVRQEEIEKKIEGAGYSVVK